MTLPIKGDEKRVVLGRTGNGQIMSGIKDRRVPIGILWSLPFLTFFCSQVFLCSYISVFVQLCLVMLCTIQ